MINFNVYNRFSIAEGDNLAESKGKIQFTAIIECDEDAAESHKKRLAVLWAIENHADLSSADLSSADLSYADLSYANLSYANLRYADLRSADLSSADLSYANLSYADLSYADLSSATYGEGIPLTKPPVFLLGLIWDVMILDKHIKIGCQLHSTTEWENFSDEEINSMEDRALDFWKQWKDVILSMAKQHQKKDWS